MWSVQPDSDTLIGAHEKFSFWLRNLNRPKFSAIFCLDWTGTMAAMRALHEANISIPQDISFITIIEISSPEFTAKAFKQFELALLPQRRAKPLSPVRQTLPVKRESTQAHRKGKALV